MSKQLPTVLVSQDLTEIQSTFVDALFGEAGGDLKKAKQIAGYPQSKKISDIVEPLRDVIIDRTKSYLAFNAPQAAVSLIEVLKADDQSNPLVLASAKEKIMAAKEVLDRIGIVKHEIKQVNNTHNVVLLPTKGGGEIIDGEYFEEDSS